MLIRIPLWILRVCGVLALLLGLTFWLNLPDDMLVPVHMLLGILVVLTLWILGIIVAITGGRNIALGLVAIIWGLFVLILGLTQTRILVDPSVHWLIQILHLLLGMGALVFGQLIFVSYQRTRQAISASV